MADNINIFILNLMESPVGSYFTAFIAAFGIAMLVLQILRPLIEFVVKHTKTTRDDCFVAKLYEAFDYISPDLWNAILAITKKKCISYDGLLQFDKHKK